MKKMYITRVSKFGLVSKYLLCFCFSFFNLLFTNSIHVLLL